MTISKNYGTTVDNYDIIVFGAGTAGVIAAIQAARENVSVLLVEKNGFPGGTITGAAIAYPGLFHAWGKQIIAGIGWEIVSECAALSDIVMPDFSLQNSDIQHWKFQIPINPLLYSALCDEKLGDAKVTRLYHSMPASVEYGDGAWNVSICCLEGLRRYKGKVLIDATGGANVVELAGYKVIRGDEFQPCTMSCRIDGYDVKSIDTEELRKAACDAEKAGSLKFTDIGWNYSGFSMQFLNSHGNNANHLWGNDLQTSVGRSQLESDGRASLMRAYRFFRRQKGLENLSMSLTACECGIRESGVIDGEVIITGSDYVRGRKWQDSIANAFYPIDLHGKTENGVDPEKLESGTVPTVPLRALIPKNSRSILAAGRIISSDRIANSALRVQATCMATGQAAGAAASLSVKRNIRPADVSIPELSEILIRNNAVIP